ARDSKGNVGRAQLRLELRDTTPPPRVAGLTIQRSGATATIRWNAPGGSDFAGVVIVRTPGGIVYRGSATSYTDHSSGAGSRYEVFSAAHAGNRSAGLVAGSSSAPAPLSPADGSEVSGPPVLGWGAVKGADYYNVQLYRAGKKVLSIWPTANDLHLST